METLIGKIQKIVYENTESDFKVFTVRRKDNAVIRVTGDFPHILIGAKIELHGEFKTHQKYGVAFNSKAHVYDFDNNPYSISLYIQAIAKWVGPERSYAIANKFKDDLEKVIEEDPMRLTEIEGIGPKIAESIVDAWQLNRDMKSCRIFLHSLGLSIIKIDRIINKLGADAENKIKINPWILNEEKIGFGFTTCDHMAFRLGVDLQSPARYRQFIFHALRQTQNSGHLFLYPQQLLDAYNKYNNNCEYPFKIDLITINDIAPHIKKIVEDGLIINDSKRLYPFKNFIFESESARLLVKIKKEGCNKKFKEIDIEDFIKSYEKENSLQLLPNKKFELSDAQKDAIRSFITEKILIITGSPGSGKTTIVKAFVKIMKSLGITFELLTPTGIAAKKLGDTAGCEAHTIHRRLGFKGSSWNNNSMNKYVTQVVIIDEVSMVDQEVLYRLLSALYSDVKLIFVGDNDQLPSVGPGSVLKELINSGEIKTIFLNQIFRQEECSEIIKEAKEIRDGNTDMKYFRKEQTADIWYIPEKNDIKIEKTIIEFSKQLKDIIKTKKDMTFQIISPRNQGPLSVETLNKALQEVLNPPHQDKKEIKLNEYIIRKGDRIIIRKNDYTLGVYNGDIGKAVSVTPYLITIDIEDFYERNRRVEIPLKIADGMIKLAYCLTVHKCLPEDSWIYTIVGLKKIKDITENDFVLTHKKRYKKVISKSDAIFKKFITIKTKTGRVFRSSLDHRFLIFTGLSHEFIKSCNLKIGDFLCLNMNIIDGVDIPIIIPENNFSKRTKINLPDNIDHDLAWLLGVLIGDGCYTDKDDETIEITKPTCPEMMREVERILKSYNISVKNHYKKGILYSKYICSSNFRDWLFSIGFKYSIARKKTIPDILFKLRKDLKISFLCGLMDTDGCVDGGRALFRYTSASKILCDQIALLFNSIGIICITSSQGTLHHKVSISGIDFNKIKSFPLRNEKRREILRYKEISTKGKTNRYEIPGGKNIVEIFKRNYQKDEGNSRGIKGKGLNSKNRYLSSITSKIKNGVSKLRYPILQKMREFLINEGYSIPEIIKDIYHKNYYYDPIIDIQVGEEKIKMFDIEVEDDNSFCNEGAICHNSQGMEYSMVILPFIKAHGNLLLQRNLLYTAITRAKKKVIVLGQESAIEYAIKNNKIQKRNTILGERLKQWMNDSGVSLQSMFSNSSSSLRAAILKRLQSLEGIE